MNTGKVALITGAANGLGWALSQQYWQAGYHLCMVDLDQDGLEGRQQELAVSGRGDQTAIVCAIDLLQPDAIENIEKKVNQHFDQLHVLINNAGITHRSLAQKTHNNVIAKVMELDYLVPVKLSQQLLGLLHRSGSTKQPSTIINIGSMAGWLPVMARAGYCAAKSALHQYFETLRAETGHLPMNILMVYPSFLATDIEKNALAGDGRPAHHARSTIGNINSAEWMADKILKAHQTGKKRLFPDKAIMLAALLYRVLPSLYLKLMGRKFRSELA
ncbi:SDR family NAD(P)-dependent oxidoreductase [uncultured Endozoicomonas sp.]|uniref:SDR family NAD(P)-dependent oxidoreductase n=1 Tax=uncultured Endozoicomonas sp. TaxID=432652 RepID=UPI0026196835|nr:SDR family NAD(P)-dependent oxidoreductase [uncultured Endozoicomonas sp.]